MRATLIASNRLTRRYDRAATGWQRTIDHLGYAAAYAQMMPPIRPAARVLDAGCGTGSFAVALVHAGLTPASIDLLDTSSRMLARADAQLSGLRQPHRLLHHALEDAPPPHAYDLILCAHLIEHFADPTHPLGLIHAMLTPGGQLALVTSRPHWCTGLVRLRWHHAALPAGIVLSALQAVGFTDPRTVTFTSGPPSRMSHGFLATRTATT